MELASKTFSFRKRNMVFPYINNVEMQLTDWLTNVLADWLAGWLADWLTN
jgi:hypothetical protein